MTAVLFLLKSFMESQQDWNLRMLFLTQQKVSRTSKEVKDRSVLYIGIGRCLNIINGSFVRL